MAGRVHNRRYGQAQEAGQGAGTRRRREEVTKKQEITPEQAYLEVARRDLATYVTLTHSTDDGKNATPPKHLIDLVIPAIIDDSLGHTLIVAPPGSVKTNTMIAACEWWLGNDPSQHIAYICDSNPRAVERSMSVRTVIEESPWYRTIFPNAQPNPKRGWSQDAWYLQRPNLGDKNATFFAAGMDGSILGIRLDRVILDDIWNQKIADSDIERQRALTKLEREIMTRLHPQRGRAIGICTRWGEGDFAEWAMEHGWHTLVIPAIDDEGESYWPQYFPRERLRCRNDEHLGQQCCIFRLIGSAAFDQQYMGEVLSAESALFKPHWWGSRPTPDKWDRGVIVIDTAGWDPGKPKNDPAALSAWLQTGNEFDVADVVQGRFTFNEVVQIAKNMKQAWRLPIVVEDVPWARPLIQLLQKEVHGIVPWNVQGRSKYNRAEAVAPAVEAGRVFLPPNAPWRDDWVKQHARFPHARHDDLVDNTSMALGYLDRGGFRKTAMQARERAGSWRRYALA